MVRTMSRMRRQVRAGRPVRSFREPASRPDAPIWTIIASDQLAHLLVWLHNTQIRFRLFYSERRSRLPCERPRRQTTCVNARATSVASYHSQRLLRSPIPCRTFGRGALCARRATGGLSSSLSLRRTPRAPRRNFLPDVEATTKRKGGTAARVLLLSRPVSRFPLGPTAHTLALAIWWAFEDEGEGEAHERKRRARAKVAACAH